MNNFLILEEKNYDLNSLLNLNFDTLKEVLIKLSKKVIDLDSEIKDKITYANLIEMLKPKCKIILNDTYGFLIYHERYDLNLYICDCKDGFEEKLLEEILKNNIILIQVFNDKLAKMLLENNYRTGGPCFQAVYTGEKIDSTELINLKKEDLEFVKNTYNDGNSKEHVQQIFDENFLYGYYENNELIGYIGKHSKSNVGLLYVKPEHRKKGYGIKILRLGFCKCEDFGNPFPYTHIYETNEPSLNLHKKLLGCEFGKKKVTWLRKIKK